jgi:hypothetical protein
MGDDQLKEQQLSPLPESETAFWLATLTDHAFFIM